MKQVFVCGCEQGGKISPSLVQKVRKELEEQQIEYTYVEDLCGSIPKNPQDVFSIKDSKEAIMIGCQPRAMRSIMDYAIFCMCGTEVEYLHSEEFLKKDVINKSEIHPPKKARVSYSDEWKPWYPVIDYERCTHCQKCQNFCLFGVYETDDDKKVVVKNPSNCKDQCPACARACPEHAIIFPKHDDETIDGSDVEFTYDEEDIMEKIQNEDVYSVLSNRRKAFKTQLLNSDRMEQAMQERRSCCNGNIPTKENSQL